MELWLDGDSAVADPEGQVSLWPDLSGNENNAIGVFFSTRPLPIPNALNGHQALSFDGNADYMIFNEISNCRTIFWMVKESELATGFPKRPLLGWINDVNFLRGDNEVFWHPTLSHPGVHNGITHLNFTPIDGTTTVVPTQYALVSLQTSQDVQASHITQEAGVVDRTWFGEIAEIIIYSSVLTPVEVLSVENYLASKYGPSYTQIDDINIPYGFCDTLVCASDGFAAYNWSSGENTQCLNINEPGEYILNAIDQFGRTIADTIQVFYPGNISIPDSSTICLNSSFSWNTTLDDNDYNFLWSNSETGPSITLTDEGDYQLTISDTLGCVHLSSFHIDVDSLSIQVSLGPDVDLCSGNSIGLLPNDFTNLTYNWSTSEFGATIVVTSSGDYSLTVTDENNCVATDIINVNILGIAPELTIVASGLCEDASTQFQGIASDPVASWNWDFGDGQQATGATVLHNYDAAGDYIVALSVLSVAGCNSEISQDFHVFQKPVPSYTTSQICSNQTATFTDNSSSPEGTINGWNWLIDGVFYTAQIVNPVFPNSGFQDVMLEVSDNNGCSAELNNIVDVKAAPVSSFTASGVCQGTLSQFNENVDDSQSGNITSYAWNFGDNTGSALPNPTHYYPQNGDYDVTLQATAINGCSHSVTENITIYALPIADFEISNACMNAPYTFHDESDAVLNDPIIAWEWNFDGQLTSNEQMPFFVFDQSGFQPVTLLVTTQHGCINLVSQQIPVWDNPVAAYSYEPQIGEAPFDAQFINETIGATEAHWYFGDTFESDELNPSHIFTLNGTFYTQLIVSNDAGCSDTIGKIITVALPIYDIMLQTIDWATTDLGQQITARLVNTGNIPIEQIIMSWQVGNDAPVLEEWTGLMMPGTSIDYVFQSYLQLVGSQFPYICVQTEISPLNYTEQNLTDNQICRPLSNNGLELFPPYPNPGDDRMFIRFITPIAGDLEINVFDISGKLVMSLSDMQVPKGFHQYFIDISTLPNGNYKLSLEMETSKGVVSFMKITKQ